MKLNASKTKEIIIYFGKKDIDIPSITIEGETIDRVQCAKLLGVLISNKLDWDEHVAHMNKKASQRLYYLRQLKRSGLNSKHLIQVFITMIRSLLEYSCQVWSTSLRAANREILESVQKRAMKIIEPTLAYKEALKKHDLQTLESRRDTLCRRFFKDIMSQKDHKLHCLLPTPRPSKYELRREKQYPLPNVCTKRYKNSLINSGLFNCQ